MWDFEYYFSVSYAVCNRFPQLNQIARTDPQLVINVYRKGRKFCSTFAFASGAARTVISFLPARPASLPAFLNITFIQQRLGVTDEFLTSLSSCCTLYFR